MDLFNENFCWNKQKTFKQEKSKFHLIRKVEKSKFNFLDALVRFWIRLSFIKIVK
jgi:hypothetical protein